MKWKWLLLFLLFNCFQFPFYTVANSEWSDTVDEGDQIIFVTVESNLEEYNSDTQYSMGLGANSDEEDEFLVELNSGLSNNFNLFEGDRLDLNVERNGNSINIAYNSDYHLVFLPKKINDTSIFELLFNNSRMVEMLTGGEYLNSAIDGITYLFVSYMDDYTVKYEWDLETATLVSKTVSTPSGHELKLIPRPSLDLVHLQIIPVISTIFILTIVNISRKNMRSNN